MGCCLILPKPIAKTVILIFCPVGRNIEEKNPKWNINKDDKDFVSDKITIYFLSKWQAWYPEVCLDINTLSHQYRNSHYKDKTVVQDKTVARPSYLYNGNAYFWEGCFHNETEPSPRAPVKAVNLPWWEILSTLKAGCGATRASCSRRH